MSKQRLAIIVGVLTLSGAVSAYWVWTHSPSYSLQQIVRALQNHDLVTFEKYVDIDGVASRMIDDLLAYSMKDVSAESTFEKAGRAIGAGLIQLMKPRLVDAFKQQVARFVEKGSFDQDNKVANIEKENFSLQTIVGGLGSSYETFRRIDYVRQSGKIAHAGLLFQPEKDSALIVELKLRDMEGYWRVAEVSNLTSLLDKMCNLERTRIERERERIQKANLPVLQLIDESLSIHDASMTGQSDDFGISKDVILRASIRNISPKHVAFLSGRFVIKTLEGKPLKEVPIKSDGVLSPGQTEQMGWKVHINMFDSDSAKLYQLVSSSVGLKLEVDKVTFVDGTALELQELAKEKKC